jgi:glycine oxidase
LGEPTRSRTAPFVPVKGHLIGYRLHPGAIGPIVRRGHTYILQRSNGFAIAGSTTENSGFDRSVSPSTVRALHSRAHELIPTLLISSPDESWIGFRPGADEPHVGRFGDSRIWLAYGHYRNGILLAPITAQLIADEITAS